MYYSYILLMKHESYPMCKNPPVISILAAAPQLLAGGEVSLKTLFIGGYNWAAVWQEDCLGNVYQLLLGSNLIFQRCPIMTTQKIQWIISTVGLATAVLGGGLWLVVQISGNILVYATPLHFTWTHWFRECFGYLN